MTFPKYFVKTGAVEKIGIMVTGPSVKGVTPGCAFGANIGLSPLMTKWSSKSFDKMEEVPSLPAWVGKGTPKLKRIAEDL